ncbi:MAG: folate-binding protein YgfZ [Halothiobacillaceae bacterium]|nr:folate-binding protein YgfZ [Halothiobacillaceae bacterium]
MPEANQTAWRELMQPTDAPASDHVEITELPQRRVIVVGGSEARDFLHAILSQDIEAIEDDTARFAALCSAKGRALGLLRVVTDGDRVLLVTRADLAEGLLKRLKLYVLRRDVTLDLADDQSAIGVTWPTEARTDCPFADPDACAALARLVRASPSRGHLPAAVDESGRLYLREDLGGDLRVAIHAPIAALAALVSTAEGAAVVTATAWERAAIEDRVPEISGETTEHYVPQWINLDDLEAFSLKKGCYPGQEVIARMHYLGKPNRRLFAGHVLGTASPTPGAAVTNTSDQPAGEVVRSAPLPDGSGSRVLVVIKLKHLHDPLVVEGGTLSLDPDDLAEDAPRTADARH